MSIETFLAVGENIHCTRIYKVGGKFCKDIGGGQYAIEYKVVDGVKQLPVPAHFQSGSDWESGKVKHCAVAIWQATSGDAVGQAAGLDYLQNMARRQEAAGAAYLDLNVDEFSTDVAQRVELMKWLVGVIEGACTIPVSVDSSNTEILEAGLASADSTRGKPMVNSVSLERQDAIQLAADAGAVVIASAAGESGLPATVDERMVNLERLGALLNKAGFQPSDLHIDPLVFPISVNGEHGNDFIESCRRVRQAFGPEVHVVAGLSNVSFGMPNRKLINQVFTYLCVQAGADGGIVDPHQINVGVLNGLDTESEEFKLAEALLTGQDDFGMNFITAMRG